MPEDETLEHRVRTLETGHRALAEQVAGLAVEHDDMVKNFEKAVESAFDKAVTKFFENLHQRTLEKTGSWLFSSLWVLLKRWAFIAVVMVLVGKAAGVTAAVQVFDWFKGK